MASYECALMSNYFHVKDPNAFRAFMKPIIDATDLELWTENDEEDLMFAFGSYESIDYGNDNIENFYEYLCDGLKQHIAPKEAVIVLETGHEKLRYVTAFASIITTKKTKHINFTDKVCLEACKMLRNKNYDPKLFS